MKYCTCIKFDGHHFHKLGDKVICDGCDLPLETSKNTKIWIVFHWTLTGDEDRNDVVAVYTTEAAAKDYIKSLNYYPANQEYTYREYDIERNPADNEYFLMRTVINQARRLRKSGPHMIQELYDELSRLDAFDGTYLGKDDYFK